MSEDREKELAEQLEELKQLSNNLYGICWALTRRPVLAQDPGFIADVLLRLEAFRTKGWTSITEGWSR